MAANDSMRTSASRVFSIREAAKFLSISERTAWALISSGELASVQVSRGRRGVTLRDLEAFVEARRVGGARS